MALLWTQKQDVGPTGRIFPAMTFDAPRERVVLFGGRVAGGDNTADTWSWDGADWTQVSDMPFGGTWQWNGQHWTQRQDMGPRPRMAAGLAFDSTRNRYVLFGGAGAPPSGSTAFPSLSDTWETFDPATPSPVS
jgi:hypothetical protein